MMLIRPLPFIVYLLHIDPPVARARHYMGICRHDRLAARLREHCGGHGARLTSLAVAQGSSLYLASTRFVRSPKNERLLKNAGHYRRVCSLCSAGVDFESEFAQSLRLATRSAASSWKPKGWQTD